jgi:hypothetical protein
MCALMTRRHSRFDCGALTGGRYTSRGLLLIRCCCHHHCRRTVTPLHPPAPPRARQLPVTTAVGRVTALRPHAQPQVLLLPPSPSPPPPPQS